MNTTLNKIKRLEQLIATNSPVDNVIDITIEKILNREISKLKNQILDLRNQINNFEKKYNLDTNKFKIDFENGHLGDNTDYIEWSATIDMVNNAEKQLAILEGK